MFNCTSSSTSDSRTPTKRGFAEQAWQVGTRFWRGVSDAESWGSVQCQLPPQTSGPCDDAGQHLVQWLVDLP